MLRDRKHDALLNEALGIKLWGCAPVGAVCGGGRGAGRAERAPPSRMLSVGVKWEGQEGHKPGQGGQYPGLPRAGITQG